MTQPLVGVVWCVPEMARMHVRKAAVVRPVSMPDSDRGALWRTGFEGAAPAARPHESPAAAAIVVEAAFATAAFAFGLLRHRRGKRRSSKEKNMKCNAGSAVGLLAAIGFMAACGGNEKWIDDEPTAETSSAIQGPATRDWNPTPPGVGHLSTPSGDYRTGTAVCTEGGGRFLVVTVKHGVTQGHDYPTTTGSFTIGGITYTGGDCRTVHDPGGVGS